MLGSASLHPTYANALIKLLRIRCNPLSENGVIPRVLECVFKFSDPQGDLKVRKHALARPTQQLSPQIIQRRTSANVTN
jgi:hypothetical protein